MKDRPILFSGPMVRSILEERKTQTRRAMRPEHVGLLLADDQSSGHEFCPYGQPGDRLWVRETWRAWPLVGAGDLWRFEFQADGATRDLLVPAAWEPPTTLGRQPVPWVPSIFLPRFASRITLEVTEVRVQRVQESSRDDILAEGIQLNHIPDWSGPVPELHGAFRGLWDSINGERPGCSWEANPWVWAVSFRAVQ